MKTVLNFFLVKRLNYYLFWWDCILQFFFGKFFKYCLECKLSEILKLIYNILQMLQNNWYVNENVSYSVTNCRVCSNTKNFKKLNIPMGKKYFKYKQQFQ